MKTTVEEMVGRPDSRGSLPPYDPLSDPALANYWARKFGWAMSTAPPLPLPAATNSHARRRPQSATAPLGASSGQRFYTVTVRTGPRTPGDSPVQRYVTLFGAKGTSARQPLAGKFGPGSVTQCRVPTGAIGPLQKIKLEHSGRTQRDAWFVESVMVVTTKGKHYSFDCEQWLSAFHGDQRLARVLTVTATHGTGAAGSSTYDIEV